mmetsp:Transcript_10776/g.28361  ORF Transcript_10776/g.28361 Transcript_10776/m.28361 type:complete len:270 (+) Transcript_10776:72-881(+)
MLRCLHVLQFNDVDGDVKRSSIYIDGHEREDVVGYTERFCCRWGKYVPRSTVFDEAMESIPPTLNDDEAELVPMFHDEATFQAKDDQKYVRLEQYENLLKLKGGGRGLLISEFICPCHGKVSMRKNILFVKNYDGYWKGDDVAELVQSQHSVFVTLHPGKIALYIFNNSSNHRKFPDDALRATKLNLKDGGKNVPIMRDTTFFDSNGNEIFQAMQIVLNKAKVQKGIQAILKERNLWKNGTCLDDARSLLLTQPDFDPKNLRPQLWETC